ncbi:MAG: hypothetical protein AAB969_02065 [Patescibacteria group bacterium]
MDNKYLEKSILSTICYFDIFDYPLTLLEVWQWLFTDSPINQKVDLLTVKKTLEDSQYLNDKLSFKDGFYFLKNRDDIVLTRLKRYVISGNKNKIAKHGVGALKFLPFIKLVGLCNNSGNNNIRADSDIDLFIYGDPEGLKVVNYELKLQREIQVFVCKDDIDLKKFGVGLIRNIIKGNIIKGNLDFVRIELNA